MQDARENPGFPFVPMLLNTAALPFDDENYAFEVKYDGVRMTARAEAGKVCLYNRRLHERTLNYPEIVRQLKEICQSERATVLDGEIIALSGGGLPDFYRVMRRDRVENPSQSLMREIPVYYMVFDITENNGSPLYGTEYALRREVLEAVLGGAEKVAPNIKLVDSIPGCGSALYAAAKGEGLEGIVAKRLDSLYTANARSHDWLKIKDWEYKRP